MQAFGDLAIWLLPAETEARTRQKLNLDTSTFFINIILIKGLGTLVNGEINVTTVQTHRQ